MSYALLFEVNAQDCARRLADPSTLRRAERRLPAVITELGGLAITCSQVLTLLSLPKLAERDLRLAGRWLEEGLSDEALAVIAARNQLHGLSALSPEQRATYAEWMTKLVPTTRAKASRSI